MGDNQFTPEPGLTHDQMIAVVSGFTRDESVWSVKDYRYRLYCRLWHSSRPVRRLLKGLLHGEYAAVSAYHSGELLNRLNNDVAKVNNGLLAIVPGAASMVTRLVAAVVVLGVLDARFTVLIAVMGAAVVLATGYMRRQLKELN